MVNTLINNFGKGFLKHAVILNKTYREKKLIS